MKKNVSVQSVWVTYENYASRKWFEKKGNMYEQMIKTNFTYCDLEPTFDRHGNEVDTYRTNFRLIEETRQIGECLKVFQVNYNFYILKSDGAVTMEEIQTTSTVFNNSKIGRFNIDSNIMPYIGYHKQNKSYDLYLDPSEICLIGHSRCVKRKNAKEFFDLDYKQYNQNRLNFIESIKNHKCSDFFIRQANDLFNYNVYLACWYYGTTDDKIKNNSFDKSKALLERLQLKIQNKQKHNY